MTTRDYRRVAPRPRAEMSALIAVAAPSDLADYRLSEVPRDAEIERIRQALAGIDTSILDAPVTLTRLNERLRGDRNSRGVDILYLVAHGVLQDGTEPFLFLENDDGKVAHVAGADLAQRVSELERPPRLIVLASCEGPARKTVPTPPDAPGPSRRSPHASLTLACRRSSPCRARSPSRRSSR